MTKRNNGWERPFHPLQITAWVAFVFLTILFYAVCIPNLDSIALQASLGVIIGLAGVLTLVLYVYTGYSNAEVKLSQESQQRNGNYCYLCRENVTATSLHCRECNKCIDKFDHHCLWLNTCIGRKNYLLFFSLLGASLLYLALQLAASAYSLFVAIDVFDPPLYNTGNAGDMTSFVFLVIYVALLFVAFGNVAHLFGFHVMLRYRGLTTYEYLLGVSSEAESDHPAPKNEKSPPNHGEIVIA